MRLIYQVLMLIFFILLQRVGFYGVVILLCSLPYLLISQVTTQVPVTNKICLISYASKNTREKSKLNAVTFISLFGPQMWKRSYGSLRIWSRGFSETSKSFSTCGFDEHKVDGFKSVHDFIEEDTFCRQQWHIRHPFLSSTQIPWQKNYLALGKPIIEGSLSLTPRRYDYFHIQYQNVLVRHYVSILHEVISLTEMKQDVSKYWKTKVAL